MVNVLVTYTKMTVCNHVNNLLSGIQTGMSICCSLVWSRQQDKVCEQQGFCWPISWRCCWPNFNEVWSYCSSELQVACMQTLQLTVTSSNWTAVHSVM